MRQFPLMIFAAGRGTRMAHLTLNRPKPLIAVAGRSLLDHALHIAASPVVLRKVINLHYLGDQIERYLQGKDIAISWERDALLETGGGLRHALPLLGPGPVMVLNSDSVWSGPNPLSALAQAWDETRMDALVLMVPVAKALGHTGTGDFLLDSAGRISRANGASAPVYVGAQIVNPDLLASIPDQVFSLNRLWDCAIATGRACGILYDGQWCDVGRPEGIALAEAMLAGSGDV